MKHDDGFIAQGGPWGFPWAPTSFKTQQMCLTITGCSKWAVVCLVQEKAELAAITTCWNCVCIAHL